MKKSFFVLFVSVSFCMVLSGYGFAEEKVYTVGVEDISYFPHYAMKDGEYVGLVREIFDAFVEKNGWRFVYKPLPVKRLHKNFADGKLDFVYPNNPEWLTEMKTGVDIRYSDPVVNVIDGVVVRPENKGRGLEKLRMLGTIQGFTLPAYEELIKAGKVKVSESYKFEGLIESTIKRKAIDGAYVTVDSALYHLREALHTPDALVFDPDLPYDVAAHSLSSIRHPDIIDKLNRFLKQEKELTDRLKKKYKIIVVSGE